MHAEPLVTHDRDAPREPRSVQDIVRIVLAVGPLAGIASYVILRQVYVVFLNRFNLSPEDLGLTYFDILTRSLGAIVFGIGVPIGAVVLTIYMTRGFRPPVLLLMGMLAALWFAEPRSRLFVLICLPAVAWLVAKRKTSRESSVRLVGRVILLISISVLALSTVAELFSISDEFTKLVSMGRTTDAITEYGLPLIGFRPTSARIRPIGSGPEASSSIPVCPMYIGTHDGTLFVWDVIQHETVRIPESLVVLHLPPHPENQQLSLCLRRELHRTVSHVKAKSTRRCLQDAASGGAITRSMINQCFRQQVIRSVTQMFPGRRFRKCLRGAALDHGVAFQSDKLRRCFVEEIVRRVAARVPRLDANQLAACVRPTIETAPIDVRKKALEHCVKRATTLAFEQRSV